MSSVPSGGGGGGLSAFPIFGSIIGAGVSMWEAHENNARIRTQAKLAFGRINDFITQNRVDRLRSTEQLSRQAQIDLGAVTNISPDSQAAIETIASRIVRGVSSDQFSINEEARRQEVAANAQKVDVRNDANAHMQNLALAALGGAASGYSHGAALGSAISGPKEATQAAAHENVMFNQNYQIGQSRLEGLRSEQTYYDHVNAAYGAGYAVQLGMNQAVLNSPYFPHFAATMSGMFGQRSY